MGYRPPYKLATGMILKVTKITELIGQIKGLRLLSGDVRLRKVNQIKSLQSSLAIEGNSLTEEQITALLDGKLVLGPKNEILEVQNAAKVYKRLESFRAGKEDDLLNAHKTLMVGLIPDAGNYRQSGVGVVDGDRVIRVGPPYRLVPKLMGELFEYLTDYEEEIIIKSCVFHYEFEFIHPFSDGNGRMGRLWQTIILKEHYPILAYVPFETIIYQRQQAYYKALADSQLLGSSEPFIYFMLDALITSLENTLQTATPPVNVIERVAAFQEEWLNPSFTRLDYRQYHKVISTATASRDLEYMVKNKIVKKIGDKRTTRYNFL